MTYAGRVAEAPAVRFEAVATPVGMPEHLDRRRGDFCCLRPQKSPSPRTLIRADAQALGNIEFTQTAEEAKVKGRATYNDSDSFKSPMIPTEN